MAAPSRSQLTHEASPRSSVNASHDRPPLGLRGQGVRAVVRGPRRAKQGVVVPRLPRQPRAAHQRAQCGVSAPRRPSTTPPREPRGNQESIAEESKGHSRRRFPDGAAPCSVDGDELHALHPTALGA